MADQSVAGEQQRSPGGRSRGTQTTFLRQVLISAQFSPGWIQFSSAAIAAGYSAVQ